MKHIIVLLLAFNVILLNAQRNTTEIKNVKLDIKENNVIIGYDIVNFKAGQQFDIGIYFLDEESKSHFPKTVSGDVGNHVPGGESKELIWDVTNDYDELNFTLRPHFIVNGMKQGANLGGPKWAYLSMAMPGMGDYFVVDHKEVALVGLSVLYIQLATPRIVHIGHILGETEVDRRLGPRVKIEVERALLRLSGRMPLNPRGDLARVAPFYGHRRNLYLQSQSRLCIVDLRTVSAAAANGDGEQ